MRHVALLLAVIAAGLLVSLVSGQPRPDRYAEEESAWQEDKQVRRHCQSCNPDECPPPTDCVAGIVKDPCQCCDVCGKAEFELCDHPQVNTPFVLSGGQEGKLSGLFCAVLCATVVHSELHTHMNRPNSSLESGLGFVSLGPFHCAQIHFFVYVLFCV